MATSSRRLLTIGCASIFLALWSCSSVKRNVSKDKIDEILSDGGILTKVERTPGSETRSGEVTGVIDAPRERVWKVISDYNEQKHFMPNLIEFFAIQPEALELVKGATPEDLQRLESQLKQYKADDVDKTEVYVYGVGDFPWPLPNRRYILKIVRDAQGYTTHAKMVIGEMKVNETAWELKPYGADGLKTLANYRVLLDPGMPVPGFAIRMAANSTLPEVINAVRRRVKDARYELPKAAETDSR